ncbi:DNA mismatch repair endonuclease MutL [bacterium]|nr:DNA mismatch repair endonuclease MutL [bacterium]
MSPIQVLPQTLINQIAAGEVVVRMANVIKELVENSLDAGATQIEVSLANDIRDVEVRDDGLGMNRDDAELCLQRHATSKIRSVEDLFCLHTRGFRGEAMPSIASVSRMEIQTRERGALAGTRVVVEGGRIMRIEAVGCPPGTRIIVRDLFYNTPARLKYLKSSVSEANASMTTLSRQALAQPQVGFRIERDGRTVLELPARQTLADRFSTLLGSQVTRPTIALQHERHGIQVHGILGHPLDARTDRRSQYFFINERPFSNRALGASLEQACRGYAMIGRFPIGVFFLTVPPDTVDFNVHPTKEEVRFQDERAVAGALYHAVQAALAGSAALVGEMKLKDDEPSAPTVTASGPPPPAFFTSPEALVRRVFDRKQAIQSDFIGLPGKQASAPPIAVPARGPLIMRRGSEVISAGPGEHPDSEFWSMNLDPEPLGQVALTYIVARYGEDMLLVDQHASHERLVYLELKRRASTVHSQPQLIPLTFELSPQQSETLRALLPEFSALGFDIEPFGARTWAIQSLPTDLPEFDPIPLVSEMIDDFEEARRIDALSDLRDRVLIRTACHSAIRAGQELTPSAMKELLRQIRAEKLSLTCPHGRPTIVRLGKAELDRQFKRIV